MEAAEVEGAKERKGGKATMEAAALLGLDPGAPDPAGLEH